MLSIVKKDFFRSVLFALCFVMLWQTYDFGPTRSRRNGPSDRRQPYRKQKQQAAPKVQDYNAELAALTNSINPPLPSPSQQSQQNPPLQAPTPGSDPAAPGLIINPFLQDQNIPQQPAYPPVVPPFAAPNPLTNGTPNPTNIPTFPVQNGMPLSLPQNPPNPSAPPLTGPFFPPPPNNLFPGMAQNQHLSNPPQQMPYYNPPQNNPLLNGVQNGQNFAQNVPTNPAFNPPLLPTGAKQNAHDCFGQNGNAPGSMLPFPGAFPMQNSGFNPYFPTNPSFAPYPPSPGAPFTPANAPLANAPQLPKAPIFNPWRDISGEHVLRGYQPLSNCVASLVPPPPFPAANSLISQANDKKAESVADCCDRCLENLNNQISEVDAAESHNHFLNGLTLQMKNIAFFARRFLRTTRNLYQLRKDGKYIKNCHLNYNDPDQKEMIEEACKELQEGLCTLHNSSLAAKKMFLDDIKKCTDAQLSKAQNRKDRCKVLALICAINSKYEELMGNAPKLIGMDCDHYEVNQEALDKLKRETCEYLNMIPEDRAICIPVLIGAVGDELRALQKCLNDPKAIQARMGLECYLCFLNELCIEEANLFRSSLGM